MFISMDKQILQPSRIEFDDNVIWDNGVRRISYLGFGLGVGFEREFSSGIILSINPYARTHIVAGILLQSGVNFGIGYKF